MQKGQTTMADLNNELDLNAPVAPTPVSYTHLRAHET